jgi:hypothetical protein
MTRGIDQLLCADAANADETKGLFDWFDAALLGAFNRATRMFDWFTALIEHHGSDGEDLRAIHQCREALGARDGAELTAMRARLLRSRRTLGARPRWGCSVSFRRKEGHCTAICYATGPRRAYKWLDAGSPGGARSNHCSRGNFD